MTLLIRYPPPSQQSGPATFIQDAIYLRDHLDKAGGSFIITKYSGRQPSFSTRPSTPVIENNSKMQRPTSPSKASLRSPLRSPARFLQQQSFEAILHDAAKGVFDRGEKLGINKAVRDAVGEVKKNMQGFQVGPQAGSRSPQRHSDASRRYLDDGRLVSLPRKALTAMEVRSRGLAKMLDEAIEDLGKVQKESSNGSPSKQLTAGIDLALAKIQFVKVYLDDSTIPLPVQDAVETGISPASEHSGTSASEKATGLPSEQQQSNESSQQASETESNAALPPVEPAREPAKIVSIEQTETCIPPSEPSKTKATTLLVRPMVNPTRSTLAQSSFAWMLESSEPSSSSLKPKSGSLQSAPTFGSSGKRRENLKGNNKSAFLFGDSGDETDHRGSRKGSQGENLEGFDLDKLRTGKGRTS